MIRVMIAEDQTLVREGLRSLLDLSERATVVGEVADGSEVLDGVRQCLPDVILMDIRMPRTDGIEALRLLRAAGIDIPCIILTTFDDHELVLKGLRAGARGYLLKDVTLESLVNAIVTVHAGETLIQPGLTERVIQGLRQTEGLEPVLAAETLTRRETEVLRLMAGGYSNREIALAMHRSEGTIKNQVSSILEKLGVRDRTQAVLRAINSGIL
ncbi:MAG: response regulator [Pseudomonadota bacterium]